MGIVSNEEVCTKTCEHSEAKMDFPRVSKMETEILLTEVQHPTIRPVALTADVLQTLQKRTCVTVTGSIPNQLQELLSGNREWNAEDIKFLDQCISEGQGPFLDLLFRSRATFSKYIIVRLATISRYEFAVLRRQESEESSASYMCCTGFSPNILIYFFGLWVFFLCAIFYIAFKQYAW